jgi:hypothetical protein
MAFCILPIYRTGLYIRKLLGPAIHLYGNILSGQLNYRSDCIRAQKVVFRSLNDPEL